MLAGRNINEDVAESLMFAGRSINEDVANKLLRAADTISQAMHGLDQALPPWNHAVEQSDHLGGGSNFGHMVVTPPSVKIIDNWKVKFKAFFWGTGVGFLTWGHTHLLYDQTVRNRFQDHSRPAPAGTCRGRG